MKQDIKLNLEEGKFKFRVAGIVENKGKVLVTKMHVNNFFCFPGGHVELLEDTNHAIRRELAEELYFDFKLKKLFCVHENFFHQGLKGFHELCFYYTAEPVDKDMNMKDVYKDELDNGSHIIHHFKWLTREELAKEDVRPKQLVKEYLENSVDFKHLIFKE